jgi:hypothetical protein
MASAFKPLLLICSALFLVATPVVDAAQNKAKPTKNKASAGPGVLYRYTDETGAVVVKDFLPPEIVPKGYTILNAYGQTLEVVPPVRSKAEQAEEKRLKAQAAAEDRARKEAIRRDAELIRQFSTVEDIMRARDTQLSALDVQISIRNGQTTLLTSQLEDMQRHAADYERRGQPVPGQLLKDIQESQRQIDDNKAFVDTQNGEKNRIADRFKNDIVRFKELQTQRLLRKRDEAGVVGAEGTTAVVMCSDNAHCGKVWQLAQIYARDNGSRGLEIVTDTLILTGKPVKDSDVSLAFSKVPERNQGSQVVLEVSCTSSDEGTALCASERVRQIVGGFETYLNSRL